jgi:hypothetical protein
MSCVAFICAFIFAIWSGGRHAVGRCVTHGRVRGRRSGDQKGSAGEDGGEWNQAEMNHDEFLSGLGKKGDNEK